MYYSYCANSVEFYLRYSPKIPVNVQARFAHDPKYASATLANPALDPTILASAIRRGLPLADSYSLAGHQMSLETAKAYLAAETRVTVLREFLRFNHPSTVQDLNLILDNLRTPKLIPHLYNTVRANHELADIVGARLSGYEALTWLADTLNPDMARLKTAIAEARKDSRSLSNLGPSLSRVFNIHPGSIEMIRDTHLYIERVAAASSIHLTEELACVILGISPKVIRDLDLMRETVTATPVTIQVALAKNPVVSPRILLYFEHGRTISDRVRRIARRRYKEKIPCVRPGFKDLTVAEFDFIMDLAHRASLFGDRYSDPYWGTTWVPALMANAPVSERHRITPMLLTYSSLHALGPARLNPTLDELVALTENDPVPVVRPEKIVWALQVTNQAPTPTKPRTYEPHSSPEAQAAFTELVLAHPLTAIPPWLDTEAYASVGGAYLADAFKDNLERWTLLATLVENSGPSSLRDVVGVITRLVPDDPE